MLAQYAVIMCLSVRLSVYCRLTQAGLYQDG